MRLLLPQMDKERLAYGMKETALAKYYIDILSISKESPAAQKLLNYRAPAAAKQDAGILYTVHNNRMSFRTCYIMTYLLPSTT